MKLKKHFNSLDILWIIIGVGLFTLISYINVTKFNYLNFSDPSSEMFEYIKAVWSEKSIIPSTWKNSNELLIRRNIFSALPIYAITKDLFLTYQINSIITNLGVIGAFVFFLKGIGIEKNYIPVAIALLLGMFSLGDVQTLLFITQGYSIYIIVVFLTIYIMATVNENKGYKRNLKIGVGSILAMYMGIAGIKMTLLLYIPFICLDFILYFIGYLKERTIFNSFFSHFICTVFIFVSNLLGVVIYILFFKQYTSDAYYTFNVLPFNVVIPNFYKQVVALLESLSVKPIGIFKSFATIDSLYKIFIVFICVVGSIYFVKHKKFNKSFYAVSALICSVCISMICMGLADFRISSRYYFLAPVACSIILTLLYREVFKSEYKELKVLSIVILIGGIGLNCATYYRHYAIGFIEEAKQLQMKETEFLEERGYNTIFASRWNSNVLSGYSNGKLDTANICYGSFEPFEFLTNTEYYNRNKDVVFILTDAQENLVMRESLPSKHFLQNGKKLREIGFMNLYFYASNPLKKFILPDAEGEKAEFKLENIDCKIVNGKMDIESGDIVSNFRDEDKSAPNKYINAELGEWEIVLQSPIESPRNIVIYGPGIDVETGKYRITLDYSVGISESHIPGSFSITSNNLAKIGRAHV